MGNIDLRIFCAGENGGDAQKMERSRTVQILKFEGLATWMLRSLELSDHMMFPFTMSFEGST